MKTSILATIITIALSTAFSQVPKNISNEEKVYGLSRFWQEVNYNFVYLDRVNRSTWDSTYQKMITVVQNTKNVYEYYRELQRFAAILHDGHTNVFFPPGIDSLVFNQMFGEYRILLSNIEGKVIVTRTNLRKKDDIVIGSEIIKVNGMTTEDYIARHVAPYFCSSTSHVLQDLCAQRLLQGLKGDRYLVTFRAPDGALKELSLTHERTDEEEVFPPFETRTLLDFNWYDQRIAYVALNNFGDRKINTLFQQLLPELSKARALILDLRYNNGGSTGIGRAILQHLTPDSVLYGARSISRLHIPSFKAWGSWISAKDTAGNEWQKKSLLHFQDKAYHEFAYSPDTIKGIEQRIVVPTVLLIGHNTASAAEDFLIYADNQKHMVTIGQKTFGSTGQPYVFGLPGGGSARICTKKDTYPDGREFVGYGIKPDIEIVPTVADYLQGNDPVLNKALEYLRERSK